MTWTDWNGFERVVATLHEKTDWWDDQTSKELLNILNDYRLAVLKKIFWKDFNIELLNLTLEFWVGAYRSFIAWFPAEIKDNFHRWVKMLCTLSKTPDFSEKEFIDSFFELIESIIQDAIDTDDLITLKHLVKFWIIYDETHLKYATDKWNQQIVALINYVIANWKKS